MFKKKKYLINLFKFKKVGSNVKRIVFICLISIKVQELTNEIYLGR